MESHGTRAIDWSSTFGFGVLCGFAVFLAYLTYVTKLINNILLYKYGVACQAKVLSKRSEIQRSRSSNGRTTETKLYYITIKIKYDNVPDYVHENMLLHDEAVKERRISQGQYQKYNEGDTVRYIYLVSHPSRDKIRDTQYGSYASEVCSCRIHDTIFNIIFWFILWNGLAATFIWIAFQSDGYICVIITVIWYIIFMSLCQLTWFYCSYERKTGKIPKIAQDCNVENEESISL